MEPMLAKNVRVKTFQADDETALDKDVNEWLAAHVKATVLDMTFGHAMAASKEQHGWSFSVMVVYSE